MPGLESASCACRKANFGPKAVQSKRNNESGITNSADVTALGQAAAAWRHYCVCEAGILHISCRTCGLGRATRIYLHARSQTRDSPPNLACSLVRARTLAQKHFAPFRSFSDLAAITGGPLRKLRAHTPGVEKLTAAQLLFRVFAWKGQGLSRGKSTVDVTTLVVGEFTESFFAAWLECLIFVETNLWWRGVKRKLPPPLIFGTARRRFYGSFYTLCISL